MIKNRYLAATCLKQPLSYILLTGLSQVQLYYWNNKNYFSVIWKCKILWLRIFNMFEMPNLIRFLIQTKWLLKRICSHIRLSSAIMKKIINQITQSNINSRSKLYHIKMSIIVPLWRSITMKKPGANYTTLEFVLLFPSEEASGANYATIKFAW